MTYLLLAALAAASFAADKLERVEPRPFTAPGTAAELQARAQECGAAPEVKVDYTSLLVAYSVRAKLAFAARDGSFRMTFTDVAIRRREDKRSEWAPVDKTFGSGWSAAQDALLGEAERIARCVQAAAKGTAPAQPAAAPAPSTRDAFDKLKGLAGSWRIVDESGHGFDDVFTLEARGDKGPAGATAVAERNAGFLAVYHLDGDSILMTLYADDGNQPRLRAKNGSLEFRLVDVSNLSPGQGYMTGLSLQVEGPDRAVETWTYFKDGKTSTLRFPLARLK